MNRADFQKISIIVPVLNEAKVIQPLLRHLRAKAGGAEIIVADGGSSDGTVELAKDLADQVVTTSANRAVQMNAGARHASGDVLWFVHGDVQVPSDCLPAIQRALDDPSVVGGFFRIRLPKSQLVYRLTDVVAHYLGFLLRLRCGDHGMFCRRTVFFELGGYPEIAIMEDAEFFRALYRRGRVSVIEKALVVSPRRYEQIGPFRLTLFYGFIGALYAFRVPVATLASIYSRLCQPKS